MAENSLRRDMGELTSMIKELVSSVLGIVKEREKETKKTKGKKGDETQEVSGNILNTIGTMLVNYAIGGPGEVARGVTREAFSPRGISLLDKWRPGPGESVLSVNNAIKGAAAYGVYRLLRHADIAGTKIDDVVLKLGLVGALLLLTQPRSYAVGVEHPDLEGRLLKGIFQAGFYDDIDKLGEEERAKRLKLVHDIVGYIRSLHPDEEARFKAFVRELDSSELAEFLRDPETRNQLPRWLKDDSETAPKPRPLTEQLTETAKGVDHWAKTSGVRGVLRVGKWLRDHKVVASRPRQLATERNEADREAEREHRREHADSVDDTRTRQARRFREET